MKIHIVCYEELEAWICGKIARRLYDSLLMLGHQITISKLPDPSAQINHHIIYLNYTPCPQSINTIMVTHIDNASKLKRLEKCLETARVAICMSQASVHKLTELGISREKLQYAHMASDGKAVARKIKIGIFTRLYPDGRKGEADLVRLLGEISPKDFSFAIMGFGWADIVKELQVRDYAVEFYEEFAYEKYLQLISSLDYFLYMGEDEGSAAFIDALAAGVKTIVKPQGFHMDAPGGITHSFKSYSELKQIFRHLTTERRALLNSVSAWTWQNYAQKHLDIWKACLSTEEIDSRIAVFQPLSSRIKVQYGRAMLWLNLLMQRIRMISNIRKDYECGSRWWNRRRK